MKQSVIVALALTLAGASADRLTRRDALLRALARRGLIDNNQTNNMNLNSGPGGNSGASSATGANVGPVKSGKLTQNQNQNAQVGDISTDASGSSNGITTGNSGGGPIHGNTINGAAPFQFAKGRAGVFDDATNSRGNINVQSDSSTTLSTGGNSSNQGNNNVKVGGNHAVQTGGKQSGSTAIKNKMKVGGARSASGRGGASSVGNNGNQKGEASMKFDYSPTLSVPMGRRSLALEARSLELEEEYMWIQQQKRDLEQEELNARYAEPEPEYEFTYEEDYLQARSDDPEAEMFYAREADIEAEDYFQGLTVRDLLSYHDSGIEYGY